MTHPTSDDLMRYALEGHPHRSLREVVAHVAGCAECEAEVARLRAATALLRVHAVATSGTAPSHPDDEAVAAMAAGDLDADERAPLVAHLASCPDCRTRVASVARALSDPAVAREVVGASGAYGRRRIGRHVLVPIGLAAAAALIFAVLPRSANEDLPPHRAPTITAAAAPIPLSPVGTVAAARQLRWARVAGADRYRVTLFDAAGAVLYETQLADTVAPLPDSIGFAPERPYLWKVEARTGLNRWATSELVEFSIAPGVRHR